jgi:acid stress-induced BolA-like protein IbaG/YrbA
VVTPSEIETWLRQGLACDFVRVEGDGHHFEAVIVSEAFLGKSRIEQHQVVYGALGERMKADIHALSIRTLTPEEWSGSEG